MKKLFFKNNYCLVFSTFAGTFCFMEHQIFTLENGIRLIHLPVRSEIAWCGMMIHTGSRDEDQKEHGLAHLIEHMLFKGTQRRKPFHLLSRMEDVGGELNAYTTKEETCIYASFLKKDYPRAIELISDVIQHSVFSENELIREKEVIIDEINSYKDAPGELIFDDFEEMIFPDHPIGRNILGTEQSLKLIARTDLMRFIGRKYNTDEMVFCSVGEISIKMLIRYFRKNFSGIPANPRLTPREKAGPYRVHNTTQEKDTHQVHCILGATAYDIFDKKRVGLYLLNNILGGQGLNSRLNMSLREKNGFAYNVESSYSPYFDTGVLSIYFGTDKENLGKSIKLANKELENLRTRKLGVMQLGKAKRQMMGQLARARENHENLMFSMGKSLLVFDRFESIEETFRKIEQVSAEEILEIANETFPADRISTLIYT